MATLELALRFAAVSQLVFLALLLLKEEGRTTTALLGALFAMGVAAYMLCPLVHVRWNWGVWAHPVFAGCFANPALFWMFAGAAFDDRFRLKWFHAAAVLGLVAVGFVVRHGVGEASGLIRAAPKVLSLAFVLLGLYAAVRGRKLDLVESRRRFRDVFLVLAGLHMIVILAGEITLQGARATPALELANVAVILVLAQGFGLAMATLRPGLFLRSRPAPAQERLSAQDEAALARLQRLLEQEQAHLEPGLSIGRLAELVGAPEHRLRRLVNDRLGYRNFNDLLNRYRVRDACARLADPAMAHLPVLTIAMDVGYRSLGPFNRAFKLETGKTPTEYRREAQESRRAAAGKS